VGGGEGNVIVSLPGADAAAGALAASGLLTARNVKPGAPLAARMVYTVTCTGPGGIRTQTLASGVTETVFRLARGTWAIAATAAVDGAPVAYGSAVVEVTGRSGQRADVNLDFYAEADFDTDGAPGTHEYIENAFTVTDAAGWEAARAAIAAGGNNKNYLITVTGNVTGVAGLASGDRSFGGVSDIKVVFSGGGSLALDSAPAGNGSLLFIGADQAVVLRDVTLTGKAGNTAPLVKVNTDGKLAVKTGGKITGNTCTITVNSTGGGGIYADGGTVEISGGEISGNTATAPAGMSNGFTVHGGGVIVDNGGSVTMSGGSIKNNTLTYTDAGDRHTRGGGVSVMNGSSFTLSGGSIEGNSATVTSTSMCSGANGGGIIVASGSSFIMNGGVIRNNAAASNSSNTYGGAKGGGVDIDGTGTSFIMSDGKIYGNTCTYNQPHTILGGYEQGSWGGGVMIAFGGTMQKTGGSIYGEDAAGSDANGIPYRNRTEDSGGLVADGGQAVMYFASTTKTAWRDLTADENTDLNTADSPGTGGWE
jgi:hypothetical protein